MDDFWDIMRVIAVATIGFWLVFGTLVIMWVWVAPGS